MDYIKQLENLLENYINEDRQHKERLNELEKLKVLYRELLDYLKCDYVTLKEEKAKVTKLFYSIYKNDIYLESLNSILETLNDSKESEFKFKKLGSNVYVDFKKITKEKEDLKMQIDRNKYMVASANRVRLCLKHNLSINQDRHDIPNVKKIINYYQLAGVISNKEEVLLINEIELYNRNMATIKGNKVEREYADRIYDEIPNILNAGFHLYVDPDEDEIEISDGRKKTIETFIHTILETISIVSNDKIVDELKQYYDFYKLDDNEYRYIIIKLLDILFEELYTYYQMLTEKETYIQKNNRTEIIKGYYQILDKYLILFGYYEEYYKMLTMDEISVEDVSQDFLGDEPKKLIYAHSSIDYSKTKIFKDLKSMNEEYYDRTYRLLTDYMNNAISVKEVKTLNLDKMPNFIELKDDQVRIVLKHMKNNIYAVLGLFTKKDDNDPAKYNTIVKRKLPDIDTEDKLNMEFELASICERDLSKLVQEKGRKGNR